MRRSRRISYLTQNYETNSWPGEGGQEKTTQGEGMRSASPRILHRNVGNRRLIAD